MDSYAATRAVAVMLLAGMVLQAAGVSAGRGQVLDWRTVKSGDLILDGGDAYDTAALFVTLVGSEAVLAAANGVPAAAPVVVVPTVHAYALTANGGRRRTFDAGPFQVMVEPHEDDGAQAAFTARLAILAMQAIGDG
jgi:hypothetical protein